MRVKTTLLSEPIKKEQVKKIIILKKSIKMYAHLQKKKLILQCKMCAQIQEVYIIDH